MQALTDRIAELEQKIAQLSEQVRSGISMPASSPAEKPRSAVAAVKAPAPAASVSGSVPATPVPDSGLAAVWNQLMESYKKNDPGIWSMLNHGKIMDVRDNVFRWQPNSEKDSFFRTALSGEEKKARISNALTELAGRPCVFETAELNNTPSSTGDPDQSYIDSLYQTFGREPVDIVD